MKHLLILFQCCTLGFAATAQNGQIENPHRDRFFISRSDGDPPAVYLTPNLTLQAAISRSGIGEWRAVGVLLLHNGGRMPFTDRKLNIGPVGQTIIQAGDIIAFGDVDDAREALLRKSFPNP